MLTLLYRGSLASCNYDCHCCPLAKRRDTRATLARDAAELARFVDWVGQRGHASPAREMRVLFTPWGEALVRRHYRDALLRLASMPHVNQVAIQTNLSGPLSWLEGAPGGKLSLRCTYHPDQTTLAAFTARCRRLREIGIRFSVGSWLRASRAALPEDCPVWLNAYDSRPRGHYGAQEMAWLEQIDPWFRYSHSPGGSRGRGCRTGEDVVSVDGDGEVKRCHFVSERLGNLSTRTTWPAC